MGRKRKVVDQNGAAAAANEEKATNGNSDTKPDFEKLHSHPGISQPIEAEIVNHLIVNAAKPETSSMAGMGSMVVRRSGRLKNVSSPTTSLEAKPLVEHVNLVEEEKEQEPPVEHASISPESNENRLEDKIIYLVRAAADEYLKSKVSTGEDVISSSDISYKSLYFSAQKKIEALIEEHYQLVKKLEFANGKLAAYEGLKGDSVLVYGLGKSADVAVNLSPVQKSTIPTPPATSTEGANEPRQKRAYRKRVTWPVDPTQLVQQTSIPTPPATSAEGANEPGQKRVYKKRVTSVVDPTLRRVTRNQPGADAAVV